jgi:anti-sigma B factor antagonist
MLSLTIHNLGKVTLFRCAGRITAGDGDVLRNAILTPLHQRTVVLDLAEVSAVDAAGLGILVSLRTWAHATGTELKLLNVTPRVEQVLELTNLRSVFEVCSVRDMIDLLCRLTGRQGRQQLKPPWVDKSLSFTPLRGRETSQSRY